MKPKSLFNKLKSFVNTNRKNCSYCNRQFTKKLWCKKCDPFRMIEGWTSGNDDVDKFIKDGIYEASFDVDTSVDDIFYDDDYYDIGPSCLEWVPFNKFKSIKLIGEGGFSKVYSATWINGKKRYAKQYDGSWKKFDSKPMKVALKKLNGSQNISAEYLNEIKTYFDLCKSNAHSLKVYGITKDPKSNEFLIIIQFANKGNLRCILSSNFNNILWKNKILCLYHLITDLNNLHELGYFHNNFHSGNILQNDNIFYISDFGLFGPLNEQKSVNKIYGVLPYIAPEVLNGGPYTLSSDIYSFGIIMAELSSGKPPFHDRKHDSSLSVAICNGLRPEFGKGTPEIYKKLAYRCMNANQNQRPKANALYKTFNFWFHSINKKEEIKIIFEEADKEIPNIPTSYEKDHDSVYTSRGFMFVDLPNPINSPDYNNE